MPGFDPRREGVSSTTSSALSADCCLSVLDERRDGIGNSEWLFLGALPTSAPSSVFEAAALDEDAC